MKVFKIRFLKLPLYYKFGQRNVSLKLRGLSTESDCESDPINDVEFNQLTKEIQGHLLPQLGHKVLILQPSRSHGKLRLTNSAAEQSLVEARALVNTLHQWTLVDEEHANTRFIDSTTFFTKGTYDELTRKFQARNDISAIFLNWKYLSSFQIMNLEKDWKKVVYDRYMMVLQIFKLHAHTAESKLQVQLAEMPYYRSRLYGYHLKSHSNIVLNQIDKSLNAIGLQNSSMEEKHNIIKNREHKIKEKIKELENKRDNSRSYRKKYNFPIISVVGYTNAGKTSLIKHLTKDEKIEPINNYFATLDVTYHDFYMKLNNDGFGMKALLIDTIGFMSDIPTDLILAFRSTLKDTMDTDLLIHVVDVSNEFWKMQMNFTLETLRSFNLPEKLMNSIVTVGTKIDTISRTQIEQIKSSSSDLIPISNVTGENVSLLHEIIGKALQKNVEYISKRLKISQGSPIYQWLQSNAVIRNQDISQDGQKLLLDVLFLPAVWAKFQHTFHNKNQ